IRPHAAVPAGGPRRPGGVCRPGRRPSRRRRGQLGRGRHRGGERLRADMATLLMVESTAGAAGLVLPGRIVDRGHRYVLVTRDPAVYGPAPIGTPHPVVRDADEVVVADTGDDAALRVAVEAVAGRRRV